MNENTDIMKKQTKTLAQKRRW